jgi:hypothetical protein
MEGNDLLLTLPGHPKTPVIYQPADMLGDMSLRTFESEHKRNIYEILMSGGEPEGVAYSAHDLAEGRKLGSVRMGKTKFAPDSLTFEFFFSDGSETIVLPVILPSPERIVFMPVPEWVIETIWQGEVAGSYHFVSDAERLMERLRESLEPEANAILFAPKPPLRRE